MIAQNQRDVLVVDDSATIRRYLKLTLERAGYQVRVCSDASEACWEIDSNPPDFVVSDWQMSHMNGAQLCKWLREHRLPKYVYFILVTAHERFFDVVDGLDAGADDYVKKPIKINELLARMRCGERILGLERERKFAACQHCGATLQPEPDASFVPDHPVHVEQAAPPQQRETFS